MAEIVAIRDHQSRSARRMPPSGGNAEILLFTGIRYERLEGFQKCGERGGPSPMNLLFSAKPSSGSEPFSN